jgi:hypothetical protein
MRYYNRTMLKIHVTITPMVQSGVIKYLSYQMLVIFMKLNSPLHEKRIQKRQFLSL